MRAILKREPEFAIRITDYDEGQHGKTKE
eukprot:SAG22_NODE_14456_length_374_cov_0.927273_1_plen_28_part_10